MAITNGYTKCTCVFKNYINDIHLHQLLYNTAFRTWSAIVCAVSQVHLLTSYSIIVLRGLNNMQSFEVNLQMINIPLQKTKYLKNIIHK